MLAVTTLEALRDDGACYAGYNRLVRALQGNIFTHEDSIRENYLHFAYDGTIDIEFIFKSNGLDDALWALRCCKQTPELEKQERLFAIWCVKQIQYRVGDEQTMSIIHTVERYVDGEISREELRESNQLCWDYYRSGKFDNDILLSLTNGDSPLSAWLTARICADYVGYKSEDEKQTTLAAQEQKFIEMFCGE